MISTDKLGHSCSDCIEATFFNSQLKRFPVEFEAHDWVILRRASQLAQVKNKAGTKHVAAKKKPPLRTDAKVPELNVRITV